MVLNRVYPLKAIFSPRRNCENKGDKNWDNREKQSTLREWREIKGLFELNKWVLDSLFEGNKHGFQRMEEMRQHALDEGTRAAPPVPRSESSAPFPFPLYLSLSSPNLDNMYKINLHKSFTLHVSLNILMHSVYTPYMLK